MESAREGGGSSRGSKYDVFLNFRGPDTRHGFIDCLYEAMKVAGIQAFIDSKKFHVGKTIGEKLKRAIDDSKICIPVFSRRYASSKWCLLELQRIMMGHPGQEVMPVFYDVSPIDVKLRTKLYSNDLKLFTKKHGTDTVNRWRKCLKKVSNITGWNLKESKRQGKLIERLVQEVLYKTKKRSMNVTKHLVGIEGGVKAMMELIDDRIVHVRFVIIHGMGGIGKTTLAKVIFNNVSSKFQGCSFLSNVRESAQGIGIVKLQQQILNDVLRISVKLNDVDDGVNEIGKRCKNKRVLLVLDDVDDTEQVENLAGMFNWFGKGSRIIITTRDANVIPKRCGDDHGDICYYEMRELDDQYATALFQRHAFSHDRNSFSDGKLLWEIVASTGGLPLALEAVGSELFRETEEVWRETLKKLKRAPHKKVRQSLMISYEPLEDDEKELFLLIACFFRGIQRRILMYIWESSDLCPESGLKALLRKSLINIVDGDRIWMHDQLRDLGREIVHNKGKSCRIWIHEDAFRMILKKKGTRDIILLDLGKLSRSCKLEKAAFEELVNLRVLRLEGGNLEGDFSNCFPQLMCLEWRSFLSNFQTKNFSPPNLVVLKFAVTDIDERWTGWKGLLGSKLKFLELSGCGGLTRTPDFSTCLGLEVLVLQDNERLIEIDSSIGGLVKLEELNLSCCLKLEQIPSEIGNLFSLKVLNLVVTSIVELPSSVIRLSRLQHLYMGSCKKLKKVKQLPTSLSHLNLPYFSLQVEPDLSTLVNIVQLELRSYVPSDEECRWRRFRSLDVASIERLPKLKRLIIEVELGLSGSDAQFLSQLPHNLSGLILKKFRATTLDLSLFPNLKNLSELFIDGLSSDKIEFRGLEVLGNLQKIDVAYCQSLARLSISSCPKKLNSLGIRYCPKLVEVAGVSRLESLQTLCLSWCHSLPRLSDLSNLAKMKELRMHHCGSIERMPALPRKENPFNLVVINCGKLHDFDGPHDLYVGDDDFTEQSDR